MHSDPTAALTPTPPPSGPAGWQARLRLGFQQGPDRTVLAERQRRGPLAVQRPFYPEGGVCHAYVLHPPGGVVGGDRLELSVQVAGGAHALVTTPGAGKFYRSAGPTAEQAQRLRIDRDGSLEWLPQESIYFPGAEVSTSTRVDLGRGARLALWEVHCLGRPTLDERFEAGRLDARLEIRREGRPLLLEHLRASARTLDRRALLDRQPVTGSLIVTGADGHCLSALRERLTGQAGGRLGATLIEDLIVVRYLGPSTEEARRLFSSAWEALRPRVFDRPASAPRIWAT